MNAQNALIELLLRQVFKPAAQTAAWLNTLDLVRVCEDEKDVFSLTNPTLGVHTAIYDYQDPISKATCLAEVIAGQAWSIFWPGLLPAVSEEWRRRQAQGIPDVPPVPYRDAGKEASLLPLQDGQPRLQELFQPG